MKKRKKEGALFYSFFFKMNLCSILLMILLYSKFCSSNNECLITIERMNNLTKCFPSECFKYSNPLKLVESSL